MQKTNIPWCDYSWNPVVGCSLPLVSISCEHCYARKLHNMRHQARKAGKKLPVQYAKPFEEIQLFPDRLEDPLKLKKPATIFVGSMTDLFSKDVPFRFLQDVWEVMMYDACQHDFMLLTKRPKRALDYIAANPFDSEYIHLGVSICNQEEADEKLPIALNIPAFDFVSFEPLLGPIEFIEDRLLCERESDESSPVACIPCLCGKHWINQCIHGNGVRLECISRIIIGCESGPNRRPCKREWIESLVNQCKAAGVEVMVKQMEINGKVCKDPEKCERELGD